jgi:hypothetical protein
MPGASQPGRAPFARGGHLTTDPPTNSNIVIGLSLLDRRMQNLCGNLRFSSGST